MLNGGGALVASELSRRGLFGGALWAHVQLRASGEFGAYCQPCPRSVRVDGEPAPPPRRKKATEGNTHWPAWPGQHASRGRVA